MKIIEALKKTKDLKRRQEELVSRIAKHSADMDFETPVYPDQAKQIREWRQAAQDITKELLKLQTAIQYTNSTTFVTIEIGGVQVTHSISGWILRRKELAKRDESVWGAMTNRGLQSGRVNRTDGGQQEVRPRLYFDAAERDKKLDEYRSEPSLIDAKLEVVNAVADLKEDTSTDMRRFEQ